MFCLCLVNYVTVAEYRKEPFDCYSGHWFFKRVPADPYAQRLRFHLQMPKSNSTDVGFVRAMVDIPEPPAPGIPGREFVAPGAYLQPLGAVLLVFSSEPMVQFQKKGVSAEIVELGQEILSEIKVNRTGVRRKLLNAVAKHGFSTNAAVFWLNLNGTAGSRRIRGWIVEKEVVVNLTASEYDFIDHQVRWRTMLVVIGLSVVVLCSATYVEPLGSDLSPTAILLSLCGDYASLLLLYSKKDDFDGGDSWGFTFVALAAFVVIFGTLTMWYSFARAAAPENAYEIPLLARWLIIVMIHNFLLTMPVVGILLRMSYWVPQIVFSAVKNNMHSVRLPTAALMSGGQMLWLAAIFRFHPHYDGMFESIMIPAVAWVTLEVTIVVLQDKFGGAFFVPKSIRTVRFDYKAEVPPAGSECSVCLCEIEPGESYMSTPCHHYFHERCLEGWAREHPTCPMCREPLPSLSVR